MNNGANLIFIIILALLSSMFSAIETAYSSVSVIKLKNLAREGDRKAAGVLEIKVSRKALLVDGESAREESGEADLPSPGPDDAKESTSRLSRRLKKPSR